MGIFKQDNSIEEIGQILGYLTSYFLFTTIMYFMLSVLNKIPPSWNYVQMIGITSIIIIIGTLLKRWMR